MDSENKSLRRPFALTKPDIAAIVLFAALAGFFLWNALRGVTEMDESIYQIYNYRLLTGDKFYADDWNTSPFFSLFNELPFRLFYTVLGSAEGLLAAQRLFFVGIKLFFFALAYVCMRRYGYWAILAAAVFTGTDPFGIKTMNYYAVCAFAVLAAALLLFVRREVRPAHFVFAGAVFSCAVLAEPSAAGVWLLYCALVLCRWLVRKKRPGFGERYGFILAPACWRRLLYGVLCAAAAVGLLCAVYFMRAQPQTLWQGFLQALNDPERSGKGLSLIADRFFVIRLYIRIFHPVLFFGFAAVLAAALITRRFTRRYERLFLLPLTALYAALSVRQLLYPLREVGYAVGESVCHALPLCMLAVYFYVVTDNKDRRHFAFLLFSFGVTVCSDMISMSAFGALSQVGGVAAVLLIRDYFSEQKNRPASPVKHKKTSAGTPAPAFYKPAAAALAALLAFIPVYEAAHYAYMARLHEYEYLFRSSDAPLDSTVSVGALKGIRTTREIKDEYEKSVRDARRIAEFCKNGLYVADLAPSVYLDAGAPVSAHSGYYYYGEGWDRIVLWWNMHPEKRPDAVYIPLANLNGLKYPDTSPEEKLAYLETLAEISVDEGEIGYIVRIVRWK